MFILLATALLFGTSSYAANQPDTAMPYMDENFNCIAKELAQKYVKDYNVDTASFGGFELCNPSVDFKKLMNDFTIIEQGKFQSGQQNLFIKNFLQGQDYYSWSNSQTRGVNRGQDIPSATAYNSGGYFTMQDGWARSSTLGRVGTFIHEARHTAGYRHYPCQQGSYQGSSMAGCDSSYSQGGSHAVEMEYYAKVSVHGLNFHPVYKKMARLMAMARANFLFNTPVLQKKEVFFGLAANKQEGLLLSNDQWAYREVPLINGQLKRTSFGAAIFDQVRAFAIDPYQNSGFKDLVLDTYSYFKILLDKSEAIKQFEEFDLGSQRFIVKINGANKISSFDFPNGEWGREYQLPFNVTKVITQIPQSNAIGFYMVKEDGKVALFQPKEARIIEIQNTIWDNDIVKFVNLNGEKLYLKKDGVVYSEVDQKLTPWSKATGQTFSDIISMPVYDAFTINLN